MSSLDDVQRRFIDELLASASILDSIDSAAQAEAWVSGAVAEWAALDGPPGTLETAIADTAPAAAALVRWMGGGPLPPSSHPWVDDLGRHELGRILRLVRPSAPDEVGLIFEYELDGESDHDVSVSLVDGELFAITIGPAGLADGLDDDPETDLVVEEMDEPIASNAVTTALGSSFDALSPTSEANVPLLQRRFGRRPKGLATRTAHRPLPDRNAEDDAWCVSVVRSALRTIVEADAPESVATALRWFVGRVDAHDPDALTLLDVAGVERGDLADVSGLLHCVGGYFKPMDLSAHTDAQFEGLTELEPVDWAGVVLGMARRTEHRPPLDGNSLVSFINRAPEITSTIPKSDAPRLAWAFEQMLFAWEVTGAIDSDGQVTEAGRWLLPHAFITRLASSV